ncbi:MAG: polyhydroxyalkanoate synthesis repressor PhaR [Alphaproteobacteria bacterium]|nr:polyhydroxyalkanoate synthesis repressor PhaR [Alphaproteobacteria bacterium]
MSTSANETVVIKKYANRRLYNTAISAYVTLGNLAEMVKNGVEFNVYDAKNNEDITRSVLAQIIVEEEGKTGQNLLPISFLRRLIGFYGDSMQWLVPKYLEHSLQSLTKNQEQIRDYFQKTFGNIFPFNNTLEQMSKQNMAMFESTMQMFSPFGMMNFKADGSAPEIINVSSKPVENTCAAPSACSVEKPKDADSAPSTNSNKKKLTAVPTPETSKVASQGAVSGEEVQSKIAALQRQLSELARNKA